MPMWCWTVWWRSPIGFFRCEQAICNLFGANWYFLKSEHVNLPYVTAEGMPIMHGMINRAIQCFLRDTYGGQAWLTVAEKADLGFDNFEAMLSYPDQITLDVLSRAARHLNKPVETFLEDLGTYLVSHPNVEAIRRLLRFGGENFTEFLFSLNELEGRSKLALPDLEVPALTVESSGDGTFRLSCASAMPGFGYAMVGVMRAMADDYGALVFLEHSGWTDSGEEVITINLFEVAYAEGRTFDLFERVGDTI